MDFVFASTLQILLFLIALASIAGSASMLLIAASGKKKRAAQTLIETSKDEVNNVAPLREPKFEWYKDKTGEFRFRLKAANGEIIATGEGYESKEACLNGIESVKKNAPIARIVEIKGN